MKTKRNDLMIKILYHAIYVQRMREVLYSITYDIHTLGKMKSESPQKCLGKDTFC